MLITGSADLQRTLPSQEIGVLRNACGEIGFGHDDITLHIQDVGRGDKTLPSIQFLNYGDRQIVVGLQGKGSEKRFTSTLSWQKDKAGEDVQRELWRAIQAALKTNGSADSGDSSGLKVLGLQEKDRRQFPAKTKAELEKLLTDAGIIQNVNLQFVASLRGDPEELGIRLGETDGKGVRLTLQDHEHTARAQCVLSVRTGKADQDGEWLKSLLSKRLKLDDEDEEETVDQDTEAAGVPRPAATGSDDDEGDDDEDEEAPAPAGPVLQASEVQAPPIVKVPALGFTSRTESVSAYLAKLRGEYPDGLVEHADACRILGEYVELGTGPKAASAFSLIVSTLVRNGFLIATHEEKRYLILPLGETPIPVGKPDGRATRYHHKDGAALELPADDPARQRIERLSGILVTDAKRRATIAAKRARAQTLKEQSDQLAHQAQTLETEALQLEALTLSDDHFAEIDAFLERIDNLELETVVTAPPG